MYKNYMQMRFARHDSTTMAVGTGWDSAQSDSPAVRSQRPDKRAQD
jgi:hypothetical protein